MKLAKEEDVEKAWSRMSIPGLSCYHWHQLTISSTGWFNWPSSGHNSAIAVCDRSARSAISQDHTLMVTVGCLKDSSFHSLSAGQLFGSLF